jgi:NodT family efflux transporter outer membrane factor (OMF) lipoprotein
MIRPFSNDRCASWALGSACCRRLLLLSITAAALSGCQVGPKYVRPSASAPPAYKENQPGSDLAQAEGWKQANPQDQMLRGKWWEIFQDPDLNALEEKLNVDDQNIVQSYQNYMAARAQVAEARSMLWPTISVGASGQRGRTPALQTTTTAQGVARTTTMLQLPVSVSWQPDLWGRIRSQIKQASASAQVSAADLANEQLSEQASLAEYYFELRGQDALQKTYDATTNSYSQTLKLTQSLYKAGIDSQEDVASAETNLRSAEANAVAIATSRAQYEHAIALLTGQLASTFSIPIKPLSANPPAIPTGVASALLERRPDIAAAERTMAAQNAQIGIGKAAFYPNVSIGVGGGTQSPTWTNLVNIDNRYWSLSPQVNETIFNGGGYQAAIRQYRAQWEASVAAYRETVLTAFKEVEDYLVTSRQLAEQIGRQKLAVDSADKTAKLAMIRYKTGVDPFLNVLTAQTLLFNNQQMLTQLQTQQMTTAVQLIAALGGGWDVSQLPSDADLKNKNQPSLASVSTVAPAQAPSPAKP